MRRNRTRNQGVMATGLETCRYLEKTRESAQGEGI